jgi:asparaginyl-tRNA synthetase
MTQQELDGAKAVPIRRLKDHVDQRVLVQGWLYNKRGKGKLLFLQVRDGTGIVQVVTPRDEIDEESFAAAKAAKQECSIRIIGKPVADERAQGGVELRPERILIEHMPTEEYPITPKEHGAGFLMDRRHLWLRSRKQMATLRIRDEVQKAIRDFFYERDFVCADSPIFTPNACEGTTDLFEVKYFDDFAYLTQSGQLYAEASAMALGKVYTFGPTFRAEKSKTKRHLTEFWMIEPEAAYYDLDDVMCLAEDFVAFVVGRCLENRAPELEMLERDTAPLIAATKTPYPRVSYEEASKMLSEAEELETPWVPGEDFGAPHETYIGSKFDRPVLIHRYPASIKSFYMRRDPESPEHALCVDMIAPEGYGEIIGGSEREPDLETLRARIQEHELPEEVFSWYLDLRKFGSVPHGGFGLGLERTVSWICGSEHLRECIPFPRMLYRLAP